MKSFCALAQAAERSLIEILHIKSPVDRCAAAAGCSAQPATTSRVNEGEKKKKKRINHAPCKAQINQIRTRNFYISPKLIALNWLALSDVSGGANWRQGNRTRTLRSRHPRGGEKKKSKTKHLYLQFARTGSHLPLLRPQPWLRRSLLRLGKPPLTAGRNAMLCLSSRY